jgi:Nuclear pore protein 84 / 107
MGRTISGNVDGMMEYIHSIAISQDDKLGQTRFAFLLRLCTHVLLAMRDLDIPHNQEAANEIIREYIHALMLFHVVESGSNGTDVRMIISLYMHIICLNYLELKHTQYS